jgi:hypothetical protein
MKKLTLVSFIFLLMTTFVLAQKEKEPSFSDYRVKAQRITAKQPNLASNKNARMYRTNLRNAAKEGVNFAGHYVLAWWGCGTSCIEAAIIDARTGKVFFPSVLQGVGAGFCDLPDNVETLDFKPNSRLLILSGFKGADQNQPDGKCGIYYFEWTGTDFKQIKYVPKKSTL